MAARGAPLMFLTASNLLHYLMGRGLVTASAIVDGEYCVVEAGRRNRNFKVLREHAPGLFVKQINGAAPDAVATLHREAAFYGLVQSRAAFQPLAGLIPRLVHFEPSICALVVESRNGAENLTEYHLRVGGYPADVGALIGDGLGRYHAQTARLLRTPAELIAFPRQVPWVLTLDPRAPAAIASLGHGGHALSTLLPDYPGLVECVLGVGREWQFDCVTHGDLKWDNLLIFPNGHGQHALQVVDWELVDLGDAAWDVASIFTAYISYWLWSTLARPSAGTAADAGSGTGAIAPQSQAQPQRQLPSQWSQQSQSQRQADALTEDDLRGTLAETRPALAAFWRAYVAARRIDADAAEAWLTRCIRFSAARLVLAVFESLYNSPQVTEVTRGMLHVSHTMFAYPEQSLSDLLGAATDRIAPETAMETTAS